ncbi:MAG: hypothetical protein IJ239_03885 [Eubacterium sp.]|nr:hypothetical protein [Eubacterium sp.]
MIAFEIDQIKRFMSRLLISDAFDHFLVPEVSITTFATFRIDGTLHHEFYGDLSDNNDISTGGGSAVSGQSISPDRDARYVRWADLKEHCLAIIRGKRTPLAFQFVFQYPEEAAKKLIMQESLPVAPEDVNGLYFNCRFQDGRLLVTSGTSLAIFDMQKAVERAWDAQLSRFLTRLELL